MDLKVRKATNDDLKLLHGWMNDPLTRKMSFNEGIVPLDVYRKWFSIYLYDEDIFLLIIEGLEQDKWVPVAQVRLHADGEISFSIAEKYRGRRFASPVILAALDYSKDKFPVKKVTAKIKPQNLASVKAFEGAGFVPDGKVRVRGVLCLVYCLEPS